MRCFFDRHKPRQIGCVGFIVRCRVLPRFFSFARHRAKQGTSGFAVVKCLNRDFDTKRKPSDMKKKDLAAAAGISTFTISKMGKGENVTTDVFGKICICA